MDAAPAAPTVVAVLVTRNPGPWFEDALASLATQDFSGAQLLVIDDGSSVAVTTRVAGVVPSAFVRREERPIGYAAAANLVLTMVQGATYFLLCHDDVAFAPDALRLLVAEAERTKAAVVAPKLVAWEHHERLLAIGSGLDRTGRPVSLFEPAELDQGQHDVAREVVHAPGAALLIRAEAFAAVGGFDVSLTRPTSHSVSSQRNEKAKGSKNVVTTTKLEASLDSASESQPSRDLEATDASVPPREESTATERNVPVPIANADRLVEEKDVIADRGQLLGPDLGEDIDLSWRIRQHGLKILTAPLARVAHVGTRHGTFEPDTLAARRQQHLLVERNRIRSMITTASAVRLPLIVPLLVAQQVLRLILPSRRAERAPVLTAWRQAMNGFGQLRKQRKRVQETRSVTERELVRPLSTATGRAKIAIRNEVSADSALVWNAAERAVVLGTRSARVLTALRAVGLVALVFGSRSLLFNGIPRVGQLVGVPSFHDLVTQATSAWRTTGVGVEAPAQPAAFVLLGMSALVLGKSGFVSTFLVLGSLFGGIIGMWRLSHLLIRNASLDIDQESAPNATPVPMPPNHRRGLLAGKTAAVFAYGALPLFVDSLYRGRLDGVIAYGAFPWILRAFLRFDRPNDDRFTAIARVAVPIALLTALVPTVFIVWLVMVIGWALGMILAPSTDTDVVTGNGGRPSSVRVVMQRIAISAVVTLLLLAPWSIGALLRHRRTFTGGDITRSASISAWNLLRLVTGPVGHNPFAGLVVIAAIVPLVVGDGPRQRNAIRCWTMALVSIVLLWLAGRGWLPSLPPASVLLVPTGIGFAASAGLGIAAFNFDVRSRGFGWRQWLVVASMASIALSCIPIAASIGPGRWSLPERTLHNELSWMPTNTGGGSFRTAWIGSPRILPAAGWSVGPDLSVALSVNGLPTLDDQLGGPTTKALRNVLRDVVDVRIGATSRVGAALAEFGIRYLVLVERPWAKGPRVRVPADLRQGFRSQLDLREIEVGPGLTLLENTRWSPIERTVGGAPVVSGKDVTLVQTNPQPFVQPVEVPPVGPAPAVVSDLPGAVRLPYQPQGPSVGLVLPEQTVAVGSSYSDGWRMQIGAENVKPSALSNGTMAFVVPKSGVSQPIGTTATLRFVPGIRHKILLVAQALPWILAFVLLVRGRVRRSGSRERQLMAAERALLDEKVSARSISSTSFEELDRESESVGGAIDDVGRRTSRSTGSGSDSGSGRDPSSSFFPSERRMGAPLRRRAPLPQPKDAVAVELSPLSADDTGESDSSERFGSNADPMASTVQPSEADFSERVDVSPGNTDGPQLGVALSDVSGDGSGDVDGSAKERTEVVEGSVAEELWARWTARRKDRAIDEDGDDE